MSISANDVSGAFADDLALGQRPSCPVTIAAAVQPALNAALWQNHVPVLTELNLTAHGPEAAGDLTLELVCEPPVIRPRSWRLQGVVAGQIHVIDDLDVTLDGAMLTGLTEGTRAAATFTARGPQGETLGKRLCELRLLPRNEWGGSAGLPDILAAFVEPNDQAVATLLRMASDHLRAAGKPDALEGYQGSSKTRVWEQIEALWRAVAALDIRYVNPPPSFEQVGQRIRPPSQILAERLATCLDLSVLFAAAIEAIGLRPVVVLVRDHAFAGFWLTRHDFGASVADDAPGLRTRLALHDLVLFETTLVCGSQRAGFALATEAGAARVAANRDDAFEAVVDIQRARQRRIRPLSSPAPGYAFKVEGATGAAGSASGPLPVDEPPPLRDDPDDRGEPTPTTPEGRLQRWRKRLLDLTGRNRLLNMPAGGRQELVIDCPDPVRLQRLLADMQNDGGARAAKVTALRFRPWPDLMDGADPRSAKLHRERLHADANRVFAIEALARRELLVGRDEATVQAALTEIFRAARAAQQEGGANTLFLTIGALYWRPGETARRANKDRRFRAPVILIPVMLERPSVRSGFSLRAHDDESRVNPTLLEMLKQEFDLLLPALQGGQFPTDADGRLDVAAVFDLFRAKLRDVTGWELADEVSLTNLSFAKYLMWKDLSDRAVALRESKLARLLMDGRGEPGQAGVNGGPAGGGIGGERIAERTGGALDEDATGFACPFEADSSQLQAVAAARAGESFVLIGPPGTGKSQTIANIIADTLSQGRSVLFVAEKRAALEVVQRHLTRIGLADFCLDLFSPKSSKSLVLEQMNRAQQVSEDFDAASWHGANGEIAELRAELNAYVRALHKRGRNGWTPFRAMGVTLRAEAGGVPRVELSWPDADIHDPGAYQRLVELVEDAASVLVRVGDITEAAALLGVEATEWSPPWEARLLEAARMLSARLKAFAAAAAAPRRALSLDSGDLSREGLAALVSLAAALLDPATLEATWASRDGADAVAEQSRGLAFHATRHAELKGALTARWRPVAMDLRLANIKVGWAAAAQRWWLPRWHARGKIRTMMKAVCEGKLPADLGVELGRLAGMQEAGRAIGAAGAAMTVTLGNLWAGLDTDFDRIAAHWDWARRLRAATAAATADADVLLALRERLRRLLGDGADILAPEASLGRTLAQFRAAGQAVETASDGLAALCGGDPMSIEDPVRADWATALAARFDLWQRAAPHLRDWCAWRGVAQRADALGVAAVLRAMQDRVVAPADAVRVFEANYARWWVGLAVDGSATLKAFVAAQHENRIERFRALDERMLELAARLTRAVVAGAIPGKAARERDPEYAVLARELAKRQRHLPVRQLAERMPGALRRLTPCLMMSPLSVAQYLPANAAQFDLVIFDEASQIATWDAIGVVGRGRQAIVVGDPKQLPPTRFFERQMPGHDGEADGVAVDAEDLESILDECLAAGIPAIALNWHYRSRHESLIAFSNHAYYGGSLVTFPSPVTEDRAVSFRHVADGAYARAGARTNLPEARAVVAEVVALLRTELAGGRPRSVGVVTFNAEQQALVENLLDEARRQDPALEPFFADDAAEPVLVKNLEGVQGEERDVMLFSLTYGPDQSGRMAMNFGPLNQAGGERRLNVAVTRAREALIVFGSLRPEHIDLARTQALGVAHLKRFLDYALHGAQAFARAASGPLGDFESPFEAAVAERLSAKGWVLQPQIGASGFRIDLGVVDPDFPGAFLAGVECDGATYHRGATARDRDRLRQLVLERLGWRILRIWSTDWWTNAAREADRLHTALQAALDGARTARAAAPGGPIVIVDDDTRGAQATADAGDADRAVDGDIDLGTEGAPAVTPVASAAPGASTDGEATLIDDPVADPGRFYDDAYRPTLRAIVLDELARSGPLRLDRLAQRIARRHGFLRTGREIQDRVAAAIPETCRRTKDSAGVFVWHVGQDPAACDGLPPRAPGETLDPADVPIEALATLARDCLAHEAALLAMRDACGLEKLQEASRARFLEALNLCSRRAPAAPR